MSVTNIPPIIAQRIKDLLNDTNSPQIKNKQPAKGYSFHMCSVDFPNLFFRIKKADNAEFEVHRMPGNAIDADAMTTIVDASNVIKEFENWMANINRYRTSNDAFIIDEDPILKQYEEQFYTEFVFEQDGEEDKVYNLETQLLIERFLENIQQRLEEGKTSNNRDVVEDIQNDVAELREEYTNLTKGEFRDKMSKVFAKIRKASIPLLKKVWDETQKYLIKKMIEGTLDPQNIQHLIDKF